MSLLRYRLLAGLVIVLVGCSAELPATTVSPSPSAEPSAVASAEPSPTNRPTVLPSVRPSPTATATALPPSPSPTPPATPSPSAAELRWREVGSLEQDEFGINALVGFEGGYVAATRGLIWLSQDGTSWESVASADWLEPCPGSLAAAEPVADVRGGAGGPGGVLLVGYEYVTDACLDEDPERPLRAVAWFSTDGRNWTRSAIDATSTTSISRLAWSSDAGWEAVVQVGNWWQPQGQQRTSLWRSVDGVAWSPAGEIQQGQVDEVTGGLGANGVRLLALDGGRLRGSTDGDSWQSVSSGVPEDIEIAHVLPLAPGNGAAWLVVAHQHRDPEGEFFETARSWTSVDLGNWHEVPFPRAAGRVWSLVAFAEGYFASGTPCVDEFDVCDPLAPRHFVSADGRSWQRLRSGLDEEARFAAGPAGLMAVDESGRVWLLSR